MRRLPSPAICLCRFEVEIGGTMDYEVAAELLRQGVLTLCRQLTADWPGLWRDTKFSRMGRGLATFPPFLRHRLDALASAPMCSG